MLIRSALRFVLILVLLSIFLYPVSAEKATKCDTEECHITITIKIAFVGPEATTDYINRAVDEIETEWNGDPFGTIRTYGDCECPFEVDVITDKVDNCDSAPSDYHCVEVTDYDSKPPYSANDSVIQQVKNGTVDPRTSDLVERHRGYMDEVSQGESVHGWWSDIMSTPDSGQKYLDFTHEAGHLMGLEDGNGGIMDESGVCGANAGVTQDNIDDAVEKICDNPCPDRCCCGNGEVNSDKNEECDPLASTQCQKGESCCPVCCNCFAPCCNTSNGEYATREDCEHACTGKDVFGFDMECYLNYHTGCWDCIGSYAKDSTEYQNDTESIWKANESVHKEHEELENRLNQIRETLDGIGAIPLISSLFANERMDIIVGGDTYHAVTIDGKVTKVGEGRVDNPTVNVICDPETVELVSSGEMGVEEAYKQGKIRVGGVGLLNSVKIGFANSVFGIYSFFSDML